MGVIKEHHGSEDGEKVHTTEWFGTLLWEVALHKVFSVCEKIWADA